MLFLWFFPKRPPEMSLTKQLSWLQSGVEKSGQKCLSAGGGIGTLKAVRCRPRTFFFAMEFTEILVVCEVTKR
jgi:hypothetical protein